ncbi:uncharacterized protein LOC104439118 [Eucalyptus grandis]|uniref:uncharacterized protein LOC104439118 n=1 Tax=Eucalyptus grandis TaxID=71139 RepID=UPI00192E8024|nr:uncharacterized protein LOC104439118 [Eucalyptus grandis]
MHYNLSHKTDTSFEGIALGELSEIEAYGATKVVAADNVEFQKGDLVVGVVTWAEYSKIRRNRMIRKLDPLGIQWTKSLCRVLRDMQAKLRREGVCTDGIAVGNLVQLLKDKLGFEAAFIYRGKLI